jgi:hypothetical protein
MISATARVLGFVRDQLDDNLAEAVDQLQGKSAADIADDGKVHGQILAMADALTTGIVRFLLEWTTARSRTLAPKRSPCRMQSPLLSSAGSSSPSGPDEDPGSQTRVEPRRHRWTSHLARTSAATPQPARPH